MPVTFIIMLLRTLTHINMGVQFHYLFSKKGVKLKEIHLAHEKKDFANFPPQSFSSYRHLGQGNPPNSSIHSLRQSINERNLGVKPRRRHLAPGRQNATKRAGNVGECRQAPPEGSIAADRSRRATRFCEKGREYQLIHQNAQAPSFDHVGCHGGRLSAVSI